MISIVVHYDEIGTKSGNRPFFERKLVENIRVACPDLANCPIQRLYGRIRIGPAENLDFARIAERLREVPGISWFSEVHCLPLSLDALREFIDAMPLPEHPKSFRIDARRGEKRFPLDSVGINRDMGARVQQRTGWKVDLENPEFTVFIDVAQEGIFVYTEKQRGLGGLPVGASGKLICLLSGGIDSPVAAFKMFRRGCKVVFVHFFNYSRDAREVRDKVVRIVQILSRYQSTSRLYLVPFAGLQQALVTVVPSQDRMVAYRRIMLRIAGAILEKEGAKGFITGDSVGQVASQTLDNLHTIYQAARYPVFAPLIGENKLAIMELARRIGTYEASILPYSDCCQFLVAKHPETKVSLEQAEACEERFPLDTYCEEAFRTAEVLEIGVSGTTGGQVS